MFIKVTKIEQELTEEAQKKYDSFVENAQKKKAPTCSNGYTEKWYLDMGIAVPEELKKEESLVIEFDAIEDHEIFSSIILLNIFEVEEFQRVEAKNPIEDFTVVFYKEGRQIMIVEDLEQIETQINKK